MPTLPLLPASPSAAVPPAASPPVAHSTIAGNLAGVLNTASSASPSAPFGAVPPPRTYDLVGLSAWEQAGGADELRALAAARIRDVLPDGLRLDLCNMGLTELPSSLPDSIIIFHVDGNALRRLPGLPPTLLALNCTNNPELEDLPSLPDSLVALNCGGTAVTRLPRLPGRLATLTAPGCPLLEIPELPESLHVLDLSRVPMQTLPDLPDGLRALVAEDCGLQTAPDRWPPKLHVIELRGNPGLTWIPPVLPEMQTLRVDDHVLVQTPTPHRGDRTVA